ncbi:hypothetical protein CY35_18G064300 [Sphagnum magellanicum]|jgi:prefoldin subunit 5|nr:hypothetical protein CY35_18G064300 [Sphagnum magellanicum]
MIEGQEAETRDLGVISMASSFQRRGIPVASFVEDVPTFLQQYNSDPSTALTALQEKLQQYKIAEMKLLGQKRDLQSKIPDMKKCLQIVGTLLAKRGSGEVMKMDFEVAEGIYSQAQFEDTNSVCLWLGANVMLEYTCEEAMELLTKNLDTANTSLAAMVEDLYFLRDQITTTEVTIARVFNWDVHQRRKQRSLKADESS